MVGEVILNRDKIFVNLNENDINNDKKENAISFPDNNENKIKEIGKFVAEPEAIRIRSGENKNQVNSNLNRRIDFNKPFNFPEKKVSEDFSKNLASVRGFYNGTSGEKIHSQRVDLTNVLKNNMDSMEKLLALYTNSPNNKDGRSNVMIDNVKQTLAQIKNGGSNSIAAYQEKFLLKFLKEASNKLPNLDPQKCAEIGTILQTLNNNELIDQIAKREESQQNFNKSLHAVSCTVSDIESKIDEIIKTDPKTADFLRNLTKEFESYKNNPALFVIYGQYMKNVLELMKEGNTDFSKLPDLKAMDLNFRLAFNEIKSVMSPNNKMTPEQKRDKILTIINQNKDVINLDITNCPRSGKKTELTTILNDMFKNPQFYVKVDNSSTEEILSQSIIPIESSNSISRKKEEPVELLRTNIPNASTLLEGTEPSLSTNLTSRVTPTASMALSSLTTFTLPVPPKVDANSNLTNEFSQVDLLSSDERVSLSAETEINPVSAFIQHLTTEDFNRASQTINTYIAPEIEELNNNWGEVLETGNEYVVRNNEFNHFVEETYPETQRIIDSLNTFSEDNKRLIKEIQSEDKSLDMVQDEIERLIKDAEKAEDRLNMEFNLDGNLCNSVTLLEKFRDIIVELDLNLRKLNGESQDKTNIDLNFMRRVKEALYAKERVDKTKRLLDKDFLNSKEIKTQYLSGASKMAILRSDVKMISVAMQELASLKIFSPV
ncbi:MAG: hypothetical protein AABZ74_13615 [Cyanobacteriota bacterium]